MSSVLHRNLSAAPQIAVKGEGLRLTLSDGKVVLDASGGAAVACLGHGDRRVAEAVARQVARLSYAHTGFFSSEPAEALADLLVGHKPGGLARAFFISSGSEAMEAALKLGRQYFVERDEPQRDRFISRRLSYHGNTLGALSVSGHSARREPYEPLLNPMDTQVSPCFPYHFQRPGEADDDYVARLARELDDAFVRVGADRVIGFVAETVVGATSGVVAPVAGYFKAVREVCDRHGALLILDEVMCGMGRVGTTHAWEQEGVSPDIQTIAKGLGGGYQPIGGVLVHQRILDVLEAGSGTFVHGQTYQAHPVACAAALEVQRIIQEENLLSNVRVAGEILSPALSERFTDHPAVGDIRGRGLFWAVEFVRDKGHKRPFDREVGFAERVKDCALRRGVAIYPGSGTLDGVLGDHILIAPPYFIDTPAIEQIVERLNDAVDEAWTDTRSPRSPRGSVRPTAPVGKAGRVGG